MLDQNMIDCCDPQRNNRLKGRRPPIGPATTLAEGPERTNRVSSQPHTSSVNRTANQKGEQPAVPSNPPRCMLVLYTAFWVI